ncbi:hypothetical protein C9374_009782 [Naegleria lovaniensis]|uniref:Uncharacterized protein n=1 Tax=Naegleria lovaniensis TaxID=51637 RepID=A0AA88KXD9_NAELO|nr:uncharacterized protein C9374_009782 [Naegleria lovaniensis]KAG2393205.1 hypothetical protein C9374_009782 [Naegleria lovaniensis]
MGHRMENDLRSMKSKRQVSIQSMFISAFARIKEKGLSSNFFTTRMDKQIASWAFVSDLITSCEYFKYFTDFDYYREYIYTGLRVFTKPQIDNSIPCWEYILTLRTLTNKSDIISLQRMVFDWAILRPYKNDPYTVILNFLQSTSDMLANFMDRGEAETVSLQVALNSIFDGITDYLKCKLSVERRTNFMKNLIFHLIQGSFNNSTSCMAISIFKQFKQYFQPSYSDLFQQPLHKYIQVRSNWITSFPVPTINTDNQLLLLEYFLNSLSFSTEFLLKFTLTRKNGAAFAKIGFLYYASPNAKPTCDFIKYSRITDVDDIIRTVLECRKVYEKFGKMKRFEKDFERRVNDLCFSNDIIMKLFKLRIISNSFRDNYIKDMLYSNWNRDTISDFDHTLTTILQQTQTMLSEYNFHEETTCTNNSLEQIKIPCNYLTELHFDYWELKESAEKFPKSILNQKSIEFKRVGHDCLFQSNPVGLLLLSLRVVKKHDADALQKALNHAFFTQFWNSTVTVPYLYDCLYPQPVAIGNETIYCKENSYGDDYYRRVYLKKMTVKQLLQEILEQSHILEKKKKPNTTLY